MKTFVLSTMAVLVALVATAAPPSAPGAARPEQAYRQYIDALFRADPGQALGVIVGRADQIGFIRTFITCLAASNAFRQKYTAVYGQAEWEKFGREEPEAGVPAFKLPDKIPLSTYRRLSEKQPEPRGREYIVTQENGVMRIVQRDGKWYLRADSLGFEGRASQYEILTAVLREYQTRIGTPGWTPTGLRVAVKQALRRTGQW
jgi:hypothetical protein